MKASKYRTDCKVTPKEAEERLEKLFSLGCDMAIQVLFVCYFVYSLFVVVDCCYSVGTSYKGHLTTKDTFLVPFYTLLLVLYVK